jgi:hypothetical protein
MWRIVRSRDWFALLARAILIQPPSNEEKVRQAVDRTD